MNQVLFSYLDTCLGFRTLNFVIKAKQSNQSIGIELPIDYFHSAAIFVYLILIHAITISRLDGKVV